MLELIRARACQGTGPDGLARSLGIGRGSLENRCRRELDRTPFQLIRHQRLQTAAALLRDTDTNIDTISATACMYDTKAIQISAAAISCSHSSTVVPWNGSTSMKDFSSPKSDSIPRRAV